MTKPIESKHFVCTGDALMTLEAYRDEIKQMQENHEEIKDKYTKEAEASRDRHEAVLRELWKRMMLLVGLDFDKTWQNPDYKVETRYLTEGFGAITFDPVLQDDPFARIMGVSPEGTEPAVEEVPDKKSMN